MAFLPVSIPLKQLSVALYERPVFFLSSFYPFLPSFLPHRISNLVSRLHYWESASLICGESCRFWTIILRTNALPKVQRSHSQSIEIKIVTTSLNNCNLYIKYHWYSDSKYLYGLISVYKMVFVSIVSYPGQIKSFEHHPWILSMKCPHISNSMPNLFLLRRKS